MSSSTFCCCDEYLLRSTSISVSFFFNSSIPSNTGNDSLVPLSVDAAVVASKFLLCLEFRVVTFLLQHYN
jgi:hypothetical protein